MKAKSNYSPELDIGLSRDEAQGIVDFIGYGNPSGVWFIGLEEGLGKMQDDETVRNLKARSSFEKVMDLREAHLHLEERGRFIDIETKQHFTQVWQYMAKIMLARNGHKHWADRPLVEQYIRTNLGRGGGETFMTELSPIPARRTIDKTFMKAFRELEPDLHNKLGIRERYLKRLLGATAPSLVICYGGGKKSAADFARLLGVEWKLVGPKTFASSDSKRLLLPFFGQGHMSHSVVEGLLDRKFL